MRQLKTGKACPMCGEPKRDLVALQEPAEPNKELIELMSLPYCEVCKDKRVLEPGQWCSDCGEE